MQRIPLWLQSLLAWALLLALIPVVFLLTSAVALGVSRQIAGLDLSSADQGNYGAAWILGTLAAMGFASVAILLLERRAQHQAESPRMGGHASIIIAKPIGDVFTFIADERNDPRIAPQIVSVKRTSVGPVGVGTTYNQVMRAFGRKIDANLRIVAYDPPRHLAARGLVGYRVVVGSYLLVPVPEGTLITSSVEMHTSILNVPFAWVNALQIKVQLREQLRRLKQLLESEPDSAR